MRDELVHELLRFQRFDYEQRGGAWYREVTDSDMQARDLEQWAHAVVLTELACAALNVEVPAIKWIQPISPEEAKRQASEELYHAKVPVWGSVRSDRENEIALSTRLAFNSDELIETVYHEVYHLAHPDAPEEHAHAFGLNAVRWVYEREYMGRVNVAPARRSAEAAPVAAVSSRAPMYASRGPLIMQT